MEIREGNTIVNVDKILDEQQKRLVELFSKLLGQLVEEENEIVWVVAAEGLLKLKMALRFAQDIIGDEK